VLYLERPGTHPFSGPEVRTLEELARLSGPILETRALAHRWIGGRAYAAWNAFSERLRDPRRPALRIGLGAGALLLAALLAVDITWRVGAEAAIEGEQQRVVPAPFEGFIAAAPVRAGMTVKKGQLLAELDTRQIRLDLQRWDAEEAQRRSQYHDALAKHEQALAAVAVAQMEQAQAQRALAEDKLAHASMRAPFDAMVVSGDLTQQIGGPVEQGKPLFELAPLDAYRVVVKVEDRDIRAVQVGQRGHLVLSGLAGGRLGFVVKNISVPEAKDGRNAFRVEAQLDHADRSLRPGMQGVAKIEVGQRSVLWVWTHTAWHWIQLQLWKWLP
jgi:RND family efflux transporter MFP subunit